MQNSRDHTEVGELKRHVGLGGDEGKKARPPPVRRATTSMLTRKLSMKIRGSLRRGESERKDIQEKSELSEPALETISDEKRYVVET